MTEAPPVSAIVADDHPLYREGLVRLLVDSGRVAVVDEAGDGSNAVLAISRHRPDVAVLDLGLPGLDALGVLEVLLQEQVPTRVVVVSAAYDSATVFRAMSAGALAYLPKSVGGVEIIDAVLAVARGEVVIPRDLQTGLARELRMRHEAIEKPILSAREIEILRYAAEGLTVDGIAKQMFISGSTVKTHLQNIYDKLDVSDRTAAVAQAMRRGLLT